MKLIRKKWILEQLRRENSPSYIRWLDEQKQAEEFQIQEEARIAAENEAAWLKREEVAQKQWQELQEKLKLAWEARAKQRARIKEEWEREQKRLKELIKQSEREAQERLKKQEELKQKIENFIVHGGEEPEELNINLETNPGKQVCPFFQKVGACRFGDTCSRNHIRPGISRVLLLPNFYSHYCLESTETEYGNDADLEFDRQEIYQHYKEFFFDVLPEMEKSGRVRQFKVCCNKEPHLRGNVYIEYKTTREAVTTYKLFNGRWYGGKRLNVEFCNVKSWKSAICGLYLQNRCPKGSACNFLHVFRNPANLFADADKDQHHTPPAEDIERLTPDTRHWRWSESPERIPTENRSHHRHFREQHSHSKSKRSRTRSRNKKRKRSHSRNKSKDKSSRSTRSEHSNGHRHEHRHKSKKQVNNESRTPSNTSSRRFRRSHS
ncbi:U2 small nuclear ribonucleoprotein auxiliary factor 35 kDa subunit-related protein 1 isoform X3 [Agrilus planipennis]|uniref:U2 small nuclear ribonucleoprotein auxiliary factor 35 kDa subunit-related protein 1 isoform X3 n=1 Tax=Agrilus planipennis TaxID=224129 RepID=A0A7F5R2K3_AGRPL|nr:U2 small nuclear ribonucleoprotein auxiliary factor 35 kDa subunit-related protein 1 isoform X3 [Agrilus planipennis]XP_025829284.1 U2 small nuclear ribonucleoprotein auxiliary factor 35 kDa subunit-related protein 1 isoform X3 [Agrilus planipennis]XP_025829285.1 U2 small nuclear ribonucleoprotein auxiliary factor 35 kDa subunit-related protein 1 isoform X3 [Agrilus planipennis]